MDGIDYKWTELGAQVSIVIYGSIVQWLRVRLWSELAWFEVQHHHLLAV